MDDYPGLAARSDVPIAGGQNEYTVEGFVAPIAARSFDVLQPDICKCGGIGETRKVIALADAHNLPVALHAFCHCPALLATAHLSLATLGIEWLELNPGGFEAEFLQDTIRINGGNVTVSNGPGLGTRLRQDARRAFSLHVKSHLITHPAEQLRCQSHEGGNSHRSGQGEACWGRST